MATLRSRTEAGVPGLTVKASAIVTEPRVAVIPAVIGNADAATAAPVDSAIHQAITERILHVARLEATRVGVEAAVAIPADTHVVTETATTTEEAVVAAPDPALQTVTTALAAMIAGTETVTATVGATTSAALAAAGTAPRGILHPLH